MCLLILAWRDQPGSRLMLLGNRDELHARPSAAADWWQDTPAVLGGRDLEAGGSWLGVTRSGRFAVVTNVREAPGPVPSDAAAGAALRSRGALVREVLIGTLAPAAFARTATQEGAHYAGFNLICGDHSAAWYASNRAAARALASGVHALSNATLDQSWPKVERLRQGFDHARATSDDALLELLRDRTPAPDAELPDTGIGRERERLLSSAFVASPSYGTRASYLLVLEERGAARFIERNFDANARQFSERRLAFRLEAR